MVKEKLQTKVDNSELEIELNRYKQLLKDAVANKNQLEEEIDNMPLDIKNSEVRRKKLNDRLYSIYDKIELLEERIKDCNTKMLSLKNEELTLENIKTLMENFKDIYDVITETERKQLIRYLFNRIDLYPDYAPDRLIKSVELNFRIYNNQKVIKNILCEETNKSTLVKDLANIEVDTNIPITFNLEENNLFKTIYEKVNLRYKKECTVRSKRRGPYKKEKATNRVMKDYILQTYNVKIHDSDITAVKKYYGIIIVDDIKNIKLPKKNKCDIIKETLIHFDYIDENCKPLGIPEDFAANRATHYIKPNATYTEIKDYIFKKYGIKAHTSYIAEIKRKHGVKMINVRSNEETQKKAKHPTPQMTKAIEEALKSFGVI